MKTNALASLFLNKKNLSCLFAVFLLLVGCEETTSLFTQAEMDDIVINEYLTENNLTAQSTESGIYYRILKEGNGTTPQANAILSVHYTGYVLYGDIFDSSLFRDEPFIMQKSTGFIVNEFDENGDPVLSGSVIPGWTEAIGLMQVGEKTEFYIPSQLAYGVRGQNRQISNTTQITIIPPNAVLVFEIELLEVL